MIEAHINTQNLDAPKEAVQRALKKTAYALTSKVKEELKSEVSDTLEIHRPWILRGFRSEVSAEGPGAFKSIISHRDAYLGKHEEGAQIEAKKNHYLVPSEHLKKKKTFAARRRWLDSSKTFQEGNFLFARAGKNKKLLGTLVKKVEYKKRLDLQQRAQEIVDNNTNDLFNGYLNVQ